MQTSRGRSLLKVSAFGAPFLDRIRLQEVAPQLGEAVPCPSMGLGADGSGNLGKRAQTNSLPGPFFLVCQSFS